LNKDLINMSTDEPMIKKPFTVFSSEFQQRQREAAGIRYILCNEAKAAIKKIAIKALDLIKRDYLEPQGIK